jgi:hypothetical protein
MLSAIKTSTVATGGQRDSPSGLSGAAGGTSASATCPSGLVVVGGGAGVSDESNEIVNDSYPLGTTGWPAHIYADSTGGTGFTVYAICLPTASTS